MGVVAIIIMTIALALYVFYKFKRFRVSGQAVKQWYQTKAMTSLGAFILAPGILFVLPPFSVVEFIVGLIFAALGLVYVIFGIKSYRMILPAAKEEAETLRAE
ncbi:Ca2+/Na+ antiporter [Geomicrobium halophilum]|uniref:Ca2+/Na+ antiporter n=1 Tax=Geomicrobium halophilum TaxID=549000 RepID=A0A841PPG3_9BACL|nr:YtpI family protein [Geomicrobium halophilum]MBB6448171.1 Ca2+/Na+ antiporter [Geomicrobium halophilum]